MPLGADSAPCTIVGPFRTLAVRLAKVGRKLERPQVLWDGTTAWILAVSGAASIRLQAGLYQVQFGECD